MRQINNRKNLDELLLEHWQCPPIEFGKPSDGLRFNR